jgi:hypothetical protein
MRETCENCCAVLAAWFANLFQRRNQSQDAWKGDPSLRLKNGSAQDDTGRDDTTPIFDGMTGCS